MKKAGRTAGYSSSRESGHTNDTIRAHGFRGEYEVDCIHRLPHRQTDVTCVQRPVMREVPVACPIMMHRRMYLTVTQRLPKAIYRRTT
jgi:hypothetical protein